MTDLQWANVPSYIQDSAARRLYGALASCAAVTLTSDDVFRAEPGWQITALSTLTDLRLTERHDDGWRATAAGVALLAAILTPLQPGAFDGLRIQ